MSLVLAPIFANGMVLQRELPVRVWGTAEPGATVNVHIQEQDSSAVADERGNWTCMLAPLHAAESQTLEVRAGSECITLADMAIGEVFVAAGQSNMEVWMRYDQDVGELRPTSDNPRIRF